MCIRDSPDGDGQAFTLNLRFPGQYADRESNLNYNYLRDYNPELGRYLQSDPIGIEGGINTYGYAKGLPIRFVDPNGTQIVIPLPPPPGWPGTPKPPESIPTIEIPGFPPSSGPPPQQSSGGGGICERALEICLNVANACGTLTVPAKGGCWVLYSACKAATWPHDQPPMWPSP